MQHICKLCMLLFLRSGCGDPINVNTVTEKHVICTKIFHQIKLILDMNKNLMSENETKPEKISLQNHIYEFW